MGYDVFDPNVNVEMQTIINRATRRYADEVKKDPTTDKLAFEYFIRDEMVKGKIGRDSELFVKNPEEPNMSAREYVDPRLMQNLFTSMDLISSDFVSNNKKQGEEISPKEINSQTNKWISQAANHWRKNKELRSKYSANDNETGFYLYLKDIISDNKITDKELGK